MGLGGEGCFRTQPVCAKVPLWEGGVGEGRYSTMRPGWGDGQRPKGGRERGACGRKIWEEGSRQRPGQCKGPEAEACPVCMQDREEARGAGAE